MYIKNNNINLAKKNISHYLFVYNVIFSLYSFLNAS